MPVNREDYRKPTWWKRFRQRLDIGKWETPLLVFALIVAVIGELVLVVVLLSE